MIDFAILSFVVRESQTHTVSGVKTTRELTANREILSSQT